MFKNKKLPHWILLYIAAILLVAGTINLFMYLAIPTAPDLNAPTWLTFWGSYLGGAIGCLPALAALYDNRKEARRQHEESEKNRRLAAMPVIACENLSASYSFSQIESLSTLAAMVFLDQTAGLHDSFKTQNPKNYRKKLSETDGSYSKMTFLGFRNIGAGPALNISLSCLNVPQQGSLLIDSIGSNETKTFLLCVQIPPEANDNYQAQYDIKITFSDIFGNYYAQVQPLVCAKTHHSLGSISLPELVKK